MIRFLQKSAEYFTKTEKILWCSSILLMTLSFCIFDRESYLTFIASVTGVTAIIFNAKGNPAGQALMIVFSFIYGYISFGFRYYGEMITYIGMTMPMAVLALISWLRHPYRGKKNQVSVNSIGGKEILFLIFLSGFVSVIFFFILRAFNTANLIPSTLSVFTSFAAAYLTFRRSPMFSAFYALNDIVLIVLWIMASVKDTGYISVAVCFISFLISDVYGYLAWRKMYIRQKIQ